MAEAQRSLLEQQETYGNFDLGFDLDQDEDTESLASTQPYSEGEDKAHPSPVNNARFNAFEEDNLDMFIDEQKNKDTKRKTEGHLRLLRLFLKMKEEYREPQDIPCAELDTYLALFFISVRKDCMEPDNDYEPATLKGMQSSFERHLKECKYSHSIILDREFFKSREAIRSKCRDLKKKGKGNRPCCKRAPTNDEVTQMWETDALGGSSPKTLQQSMWWIMCTRFGKRANHENRIMKWCDVTLVTSATGQKYLVTNERETKTRQGDDPHDVRDKLCVYADDENPDYCPVRLYEMYARKRPHEMCHPDSEFYLQPKKYDSVSAMSRDDTWYKRQPHGMNSIKLYMSNIKEKAGISKSANLSNISARKHLITTCRKAGVPDGTTMKISGHKRVDSINNYAELAEEEQRAIGKVLGRPHQHSSYPAALASASGSASTTAAVSSPVDYGRYPPSIFQNCTIANITMPPSMSHK